MLQHLANENTKTLTHHALFPYLYWTVKLLKNEENGFMFGKSKQYFENVSSRDTSLNFQVSSSCKKKKYDENEEHATDSETDTIN